MSTTGFFDWAHFTATAPAVRPTTIPGSYLKFPPSSLPAIVPPPLGHPALAHPFAIPVEWYNALLSANVPITAALVYASLVIFLNSVNARRNYKPWAFSKTRPFKIFVISHNVFLSLYSLWTFVGMVNALRASLVSPLSEFGLAGLVDSLCKINGPRGLGSAATYNATSSAWGIVNRVFHLGADGLTPESTDVGRIWNEGLAFYGWLFYISKFYEVIDTLIILAKGKKSNLLQTYHHAGAMLCMWAGIRYMSPPIWMFVCVNSFIHTVMYSFYFCSAVGVRVPTWFKRILTTLQITQFVVGAIFAFAHLFVAYQIPVSVPYLYHLGNVASSVSSDASSAVSTALASASAGTGAWLKKAAFRAAGREGLAENVLNEQGRTFGVDAVHAAKDFARREETRYRNELQWVHCLDTSGQVFAILLNVMYLAPLTWLFANFFITSYLQRVERRRSSTASEKAHIASQSSRDALKGVSRRLSEAFEDTQGGIDELGDDTVIIDGDKLKEEMAEAVKNAKQGSKNAYENTKQTVSDAVPKVKQEVMADVERVRKGGEIISKKTKKAAKQVTLSHETRETVSTKFSEVQQAISETVQDTAQRLMPSDETKDLVKAKTDNAAQNAKSITDKAGEKVSNSQQQMKNSVPDKVDEVKKDAKEVKDKAKEKASEAKQTAKDLTDEAGASAANNVKETKEATKVKADETEQGAKDEGDEGSQTLEDGAEDVIGEESTQSKEEKKEEDKIIDDSQLVRDEDVDTEKEQPSSDSHVEEGKSFADAIKEGSAGAW